MGKRALIRAVLVGVLGAAIGGMVAGPSAMAQTGGSQPTLLRSAAAHPFPTRAVWPHELMSFPERYDLWLKMRETRSGAERYALWAKKYAELEKRAAEHGLALKDHGPMMMPDERSRPLGEEMGWGARFAPERPALVGGGYGPESFAGAAHRGPGLGPRDGRSYGPEQRMGAGSWQGPHFGGGIHAMPPMGR